MTTKRRERSIKELYAVTEMISKPEITPVLEGSCRIRGPVDELEDGLQQRNCVTLPAEKGYMIVNQTTRTRVESGTCNVCSAPCSSCMHINRTTSVMESNVEGTYSINKLRREEADCCSCDGSGGLPPYKSRACDDPQHATSETSNLVSVGSSHDSYSENAESKSTLVAINDMPEDVGMHPKLSVEAVGEGGLLPKETNISSSCLLSSKSHLISVPHQEQFQSGKGEQRDLECHGDNISCATGGLDAAVAVNVCDADADINEPVIGVASTKSGIAKGIERKIQLEAGNLCPDDEIRECKVKVEEPNACQKDFRQEKDSGSSVKDECSDKSDCVDHSSLKLDSAKVEPFECFTANTELSTRVAEASANVEGKKTIVSDHEDQKTCQLKSVSPSGAQKSGYSGLETMNHRENDVAGDKDCEAVNCSTIKELSRMLSTPLEDSKIQAPEKQSQPTCEGENSESDIEDDVKVCDICGDAGREECLAVCSKCSDGAEHTYCMRIMMEKIPEGDWLCEECKLKEDTENDEVGRTEVIQEKLEVQSLKENVVSSETIPSPKVSLRLDSEVNDQEARGVVKRTQSQHVSAHRLTDNSEVSLITGKRSSESNGISIETSSPRKKVALSCDSSLKKLDLTKVKLGNITPSLGSHSGHSSPQAFVRAQMSGSYPSKDQTQVQTPRGSLSRSMSLNNSGMKGKVKQLIENIPHKPKGTKEFASKDTRKDGIVRTATKNASFRTIGSSRLTIESTIKTQFLNSPRSEDSKSFKHPRDRNPLEKKNSFKLEHTPVTPSTASNAVPLKAELRGAQISAKANNVSESNIVGVTKRLGDANDLGHGEVKKQPLNAPKALGSSSLNSLGQKSYGMRTTKSSIQPETVAQHEDKSKDSNLSSSSRQVGPNGGRVLRCQKCNETGHATQFCSIDKLRVSALKPSAERNLKETTVKSDRWKDAVEALFSKTKMQKEGRPLDHADSTTVTPRSSREAGPKDVPTISSSSFQGGLISRQEVCRSSATSPDLTGAAIGVKQPDNHQVETCIPVDRQPKALPTALEESTGLTSVPTMADRCSDQGCPTRVSVFPELEFIWQGDFEVLRTGRLLEPCNGVQAHLSTCASPKVLEVVNKFPGKVKLEEVPRSSTWPLQFQRISPKEDNIALFLFARDIESYEKNYKKLLENMLKNDLALKGFIDEVELLIFPSDKLPENAQRWNNLFFLWAVFRERRIDGSDALPHPERPCKSSLQEEPLVQGSALLLESDFSTSKNINLHEFPKRDSSEFEMSPKAGIIEHNTQMSSETMGELQCEISPDSGNQITTSHLCLEQNSGVASPKISALVQAGGCAEPQKNKIFGNGAIDGIDAETSNNVQNSLNKYGALPILPVTCVSTACRDGDEYSANPEKLQEITVLDNDPHDCMTATDNLSWESKPSRKRARSRSVDATFQASGETSKVVDETMTGKENMNHRAEHNEKEHKKAKICNDDGCADFPEAPHHRETIMDETRDKPESSRSVGRYIFPFDLNSISCEETETETEMERVIHVLSSDDEDIQEPIIPDLELALGGKKKPVKHERQPLIFPIVSSKINQHQRPAVRKDDYASASLSLSLAIPKSENEQTAASDVQKTPFWQL